MYVCMYVFLAPLCSLSDLSSLTGDRTWATTVKAPSSQPLDCQGKKTLEETLKSTSQKEYKERQ